MQHLLPDNGPARTEVDDGVPGALEREHDGRRHVERKAKVVGRHEVVHAEDRGWRPRDKDGEGEHERRAQVRHLDRVDFGETPDAAAEDGVKRLRERERERHGQEEEGARERRP